MEQRHSDEDQDTGLSQDGYEEAMPGFHEDLEETEDAVQAALDEEAEPAEAQAPISAPASTTAALRQSLEPASEPESSNAKTKQEDPEPRMRSRAGSETAENDASLTCPICSKIIEADNRKFNEHIDFCLSKGAIREAQAKASGRTTVETFFKPPAAHAKAPRKAR